MNTRPPRVISSRPRSVQVIGSGAQAYDRYRNTAHSPRAPDSSTPEDFLEPFPEHESECNPPELHTDLNKRNWPAIPAPNYDIDRTVVGAVSLDDILDAVGPLEKQLRRPVNPTIL
jgi:hypothetical protein